MIECQTLGGWTLTIDGRPPEADLTWRKNFVLLVYLARSPNRTRTRDHLIGLLWADKPEPAARRSLNVALSTLRQKLGQHILTTDGVRVTLSAGVVELDVERFERLVHAGDLSGAAKLVGGDFLEGLTLDDFDDASECEAWLLAERGAIRRRLLDVLTRRAAELLDAGDARAAEDMALRACALDDLFEPAVRMVMRARARSDDRTGALAFFEAFRLGMQTRVGAVPDKETDALAERVRRERVWQLPPADAAGTKPGWRWRRPPLEGRGTELERLLQAWRACCAERRPTLILVEGDAGMGKTRLAEEVAGRARLDGAATAALRAVEADLGAPWSGLLALCGESLLSAPGAAGASPATMNALAAGPAQAQDLAPAFRDLVAAVCEEQPLLLFLDDVQWLDRESLVSVLAALRRPDAPLAILVTAPAGLARAELDEVRARIGRELGGAVVSLGPLSESAIVRLAHDIMPAYNDDQLARLARRVALDAAGIPLLIIALLHAVASGLELKGGTPHAPWPAPGRTFAETLPSELPESVVGAVRVMYGRTSADAQRVLAAAAVLGERTPGTTLGQAADVATERLEAALDELEWKGWLTAEPRGYAFVARIFRDVINGQMVGDGERLRIQSRSGHGTPPGHT